VCRHLYWSQNLSQEQPRKGDVRKPLADGLGRAVLGRVVENDDLGVVAAERLQAREEELGVVRVCYLSALPQA
jgi:hypothetical protein